LITIAICEDNLVQLNIMIENIKVFFSERDINIISCSSAQGFLSKIKGLRIDFAVLDIKLRDGDGIKIAKHIKEYSKNALIFFVTASSDRALEAFGVNASEYLLKPFSLNELNEGLERILVRLDEIEANKNKAQFYEIIVKNGRYKFEYSELLFFEKIPNTKRIVVHVGDECYEFIGSLKKINDDLRECSLFVQCHHGYIVNKMKIKAVRDSEIILRNSSKRIPVSRRMKKNISNI